VVLDERRVLTSAHVITLDGQVRPGLWVAFPFSNSEPSITRAQVQSVRLASAPYADVAVLELESIPEGVAAAPLRCPQPDDLPGKRWWAFGFPRGNWQGNEADGVIGGVLSYGWVRLDTESRYLVESGFSGSGVWCPDYSAVIALVGHANERGDAQALTLHQTDLVLPNEKITTLTQRPLRSGFAPSELAEGCHTDQAGDLLDPLAVQDGGHHELRQALELFWREAGDTDGLLRGHDLVQTGHPTQVDVADAIVAWARRRQLTRVRDLLVSQLRLPVLLASARAQQLDEANAAARKGGAADMHRVTTHLPAKNDSATARAVAGLLLIATVLAGLIVLIIVLR
jgi:hypothetical protein